MNGTELRRRLDRLGPPYTELAPLLGLSVDGLHQQMRGRRRVSRQTELLLEVLERDATDQGGREHPAASVARNQKIERHYFERFRNAYSLPIGQIGYGDKPDVTFTGERTIGIEVTRFYLQPGSLLESTQRQRPLRDAVVAQAQALYRAQGAKAVELHISFDTPQPITPRRTKKLAEELAALAKRIDRRPSGEIERAEFRAIPEVSFVYFNEQEYLDARWRVGGVYTVEPISEKALEAIVRAKEAKSSDYAPRDAYWLLVVVEAMDAAQEQEIRIDGLRISSDVFEKIIVYKPLFEDVVEAKA